MFTINTEKLHSSKEDVPGHSVKLSKSTLASIRPKNLLKFAFCLLKEIYETINVVCQHCTALAIGAHTIWRVNITIVSDNTFIYP